MLFVGGDTVKVQSVAPTEVAATVEKVWLMKPKPTKAARARNNFVREFAPPIVRNPIVAFLLPLSCLCLEGRPAACLITTALPPTPAPVV